MRTLEGEPNCFLYVRLVLCTLAAARGRHQRTGPCTALHFHRCSPPALGLPLPSHPAPQRGTPALCEPVPPVDRGYHDVIFTIYQVPDKSIISPGKKNKIRIKIH